MNDEAVERIAQMRARERATEDVQNRLALISTITWAVCIVALAVLYAAFFGRTPRAPLILLAGFLTLIPAAIPWLLRGRLVEARAERYWREEREAMARERATQR